MTAASELTFANLLRYHRLAAGLSQEELAERAHLSVDAISSLERGARRSPRKDTVRLLADALALAPDDRAAFVAAARRSPATLAATPGADPARNGQPMSAAAEFPHGIVTFLFADIEGSSLLLHRLGDDYAEMLAQVQELLHTIYLAHHGHELGAQGDRFFAVFGQPDDAVSAAAAAQQMLAARQWPEGMDVRLRMGIHTGVAQMTIGRYVGVEVHRAARIAAAGHGGQILLSPEVIAEVTKRGQEFPPGTELRHLGKHRLGDLKSREAIIQLMLPDTPGLPPRFPPLRTRDLWPVVRERLLAGALLTLILLALVSFALPFAASTFPRALGVATGLGVLLLGAVMVGTALARRQHQALLWQQWREMREPMVALTSGLLSLVVVLTTLFATTPRQAVASHPKRGYDFTYVYHKPTHIGGSITVGITEQFQTLGPDWVGRGESWFQNLFLWQTCLVQLPDQTLGLKGWKADQCTEAPTVDNGGESSDAKTTTFHIDPRAVWSDGVPVTADDFLFGWRLSADPALNDVDYFRLMSLIKVDTHTVRIQWDKPTPDYLSTLGSLYPAPLHVYATGKFADIYNPATGGYNSALAQQLIKTPAFNTTIPVDNGPFTVQSFVPDHQAVLVRNPRFFSNFFHTPALDKITVITVAQDFLPEFAAGLHPLSQLETDLMSRYRQGTLDLAVPLEPLNLPQLGDIPKSQVEIASASNTVELGFNQRIVAPNAQANGGVSIFTDRRVRQAFIAAFDRCAAVRALLGNVRCDDPNILTDESDATAAVAAFDPTFTLPVYDPADARKLLDTTGFRVVDGVRRNRDGVTPLTLKLVVSPGASGSAALAQRMQHDYTRNLQVGVIVEASQIAFSKPESPIYTGAFDMFLVSSGNTINPILRLTHDNAGPFDNATITKGGNPFGIIDQQASQRDLLAAQTVSDEQRAVILLNLHRYFSQQYYFEPIYITAIIALKKPTLCNFKLWPDPWSSFWNIADWYTAPACP